VVCIVFDEVRERDQFYDFECPTIDVIVGETDASKISRKNMYFSWRWRL
jgi:hypothetical protein